MSAEIALNFVQLGTENISGGVVSFPDISSFCDGFNEAAYRTSPQARRALVAWQEGQNPIGHLLANEPVSVRKGERGKSLIEQPSGATLKLPEDGVIMPAMVGYPDDGDKIIQRLVVLRAIASTTYGLPDLNTGGTTLHAAADKFIEEIDSRIAAMSQSEVLNRGTSSANKRQVALVKAGQVAAAAAIVAGSLVGGDSHAEAADVSAGTRDRVAQIDTMEAQSEPVYTRSVAEVVDDLLNYEFRIGIPNPNGDIHIGGQDQDRQRPNQEQAAEAPTIINFAQTRIEISIEELQANGTFGDLAAKYPEFNESYNANINLLEQVAVLHGLDSNAALELYGAHYDSPNGVGYAVMGWMVRMPGVSGDSVFMLNPSDPMEVIAITSQQETSSREFTYGFTPTGEGYLISVGEDPNDVLVLGQAPDGTRNFYEVSGEESAPKPATLSAKIAPETIRVTATSNTINVRSGPGTENPVLHMLTKTESGTRAFITGEANGWFQILHEIDSGEMVKGWVSGDLIRVSENPLEVSIADGARPESSVIPREATSADYREVVRTLSDEEVARLSLNNFQTLINGYSVSTDVLTSHPNGTHTLNLINTGTLRMINESLGSKELRWLVGFVPVGLESELSGIEPWGVTTFEDGDYVYLNILTKPLTGVDNATSFPGTWQVSRVYVARIGNPINNSLRDAIVSANQNVTTSTTYEPGHFENYFNLLSQLSRPPFLLPVSLTIPKDLNPERTRGDLRWLTQFMQDHPGTSAGVGSVAGSPTPILPPTP